MDYTQFSLVLCFSLLIGFGIPAVIYFSIARSKNANEIDVLRKTMEKTRQAWRADDENLQELSRRVARLKSIRTGSDIGGGEDLEDVDAPPPGRDDLPEL